MTLLTNGSLECSGNDPTNSQVFNQAPDDWIIFEDTPDISRAPGFFQNHGPSPEGGDFVTMAGDEAIGQQIPSGLEAGAAYELTLWAAGGSDLDGGQLEIQGSRGVNDFSESLYNQFLVPPDNTWREYTIEFTPTQDWDYFVIGCGGNGPISIDGLSLTQTAAPPLPPCFVRHTRISTARGEIPVEELEIGDRVITRDNGYQEIRWIGSARRKAVEKLAPILFREGTIGNHRDLLVSQNQRVLIKSAEAELWTGQFENLMPAKFMVNGDSIVKVEGGEVEYFHILFDHHEVILSEGSWTESFHPGRMGWNSLCEETRAEILELFPELGVGFTEAEVTTARHVLDRREAMLVLQAMKSTG